MRVIFCCLLAGWFCVGCRGPEPSPRNGADQGFAQLAADYTRGYLAWRPPVGTGLGFHEYDGKLTDFTLPSLDRELTRLKDFEARVEKINPERLSVESRFDREILRGAIRREIFSFERQRSYWRNPMTYAGALDVSGYIKRDFAPLDQRVRSIISLLRAAPGLFAAARANLEESLPQPFIETAIDQAEGTADFLAKDLVTALKPLTNAGLRAEFNLANQAATNEFRAFAAWLKKEKLPRASQDYALGPENYQRLVEYGEHVTTPADKLLEIGLGELHRKQEFFAQTARLIDPSKKPIEVFKAIQHDHPTETSLIPDTARNLEMIRQFIVDRHLITLPSTNRAVVAETPQFLRATSFASMDTPGPFEAKATEAYYYVTPTEPEWTPQQKDEWLTAFNYYTTDIVSIHEGYPGHYVQYLCLAASPATKVEKIFGSYAFIEGWAHYAEQMMVDEGFGETPGGDPLRGAKYRLAQADEALLRLCRFCVSIQMHCRGMTVDQAAKFFEDNCYYETKPARQEAVRGTFDPEYLYYTVGKLEIFKLREDYRRQEGANFSLQKFHDELLRHGAPPLPLLRRIMLKDAALWDQAF